MIRLHKPSPAFWRGFSSVFNLSGFNREYVAVPYPSDEEALKADMVAVGNDMNYTVEEFQAQMADLVVKYEKLRKENPTSSPSALLAQLEEEENQILESRNSPYSQKALQLAEELRQKALANLNRSR